MKTLFACIVIFIASRSLAKDLKREKPIAWKLCHTFCGENYTKKSRDYKICIRAKGYSCGILAAKGVFYGEYCGVGNRAPAKPVDALDKLCLKHDECWERHGELSCKCDRALARDSKRLSLSQRLSAQLREYAYIVGEFWDDSPCRE